MRRFASDMIGMVTESLKDEAVQIRTTANSSLAGPPPQTQYVQQQSYNYQGNWPQQPQQLQQQQPYQPAPLSPPSLASPAAAFPAAAYPVAPSPYAHTPQYYAPQPSPGVRGSEVFLPPPLPPPGGPVIGSAAPQQPVYYVQPVPMHHHQPQPSPYPVQQPRPDEVYLPPPTAPPPRMTAELQGDISQSANRAFIQQQQQQQYQQYQQYQQHQQQQYSLQQHGQYTPISPPPNVAELSSQMGGLSVQNGTPVSHPPGLPPSVSQLGPPPPASQPAPPPPPQELPAPDLPPTPAPAPAPVSEALLPPRKAAPVRESGQPNEAIPECTEERQVTYALDWYRLPEAPSHLICSRCHADHIQGTPLASAFEKVNETGGSCCFWLPRVKDQLWEQALKSGDTAALLAFFTETKDIPPCKGRVYSASPDDAAAKWFSVTEVGVLDGFLACHSCYEYRVVGTPFESRFSPYEPQLKHAEGTMIMCDACAPAVADSLQRTSANGDWDKFVAATTKRLGLPECTIAEPQTLDDDAVSYVLRQGGKGLRVCETCYLDKLVPKKFDGYFERYQNAKPGLRSFLSDCIHETDNSCSLARISLNVALGSAAYQRNFSVFSNAAEAVAYLPKCTATGIESGIWWTLQGGCDALSICAACHAGFLIPTGVAQYFEQAQRSPKAAILCSFCVAAPRAIELLGRFGQMLEKGTFSHFADYARLWSGVQPCPGLEAQGGGTWYGYHELYMCKECYLECAVSQPLASTLPVQDLYEKELRICQMWSPRMRKLWFETNAAGPVGSAESKEAEDRLRDVGTKRFQVYNATILQVDVMRQMQDMKRRAALHKGLQSTMYSGMNSFSLAAGATDGYMYGNSSLGWHGTKNGLIGAQLGRESQAELAALSGGDETSEILRLQSIWREVE